MMDLDDHVRDGLRDLAATLPPSANPAADFERRLANRRKHRGALLASAAAVVVAAAVAIPVALNGDGDPAVGTQPPTATATAPSAAKWNTVLISFDDRGAVRRATFSTDAAGWCLATDFTKVTECYSLGPWPQKEQDTESWVLTRSVLGPNVPGAEGLPRALLFVTAPKITKLDVTGVGTPPTVRELHATSTARYFLAEFPDGYDGFGYTAYDAQGQVVTSAIT